MPVTFGKLRENLRIELHGFRRIDRIHAVLFIEEPPQNNGPAVVSFFKEIVEAACAKNVHEDAVYRRALRNRHLRLRDGAGDRDFDRRSSKQMQYADAVVPTLFVDSDELLEGP